jgi:TetR/AcrR family fatty acid metabolism transcriptional regulator
MRRHSSNTIIEKESVKLNRAKDNKREKILKAAEKTFAKKGFYNAKVAEIARAAGVADGTIYLYFKNKDDVLISLFEERMAWFIAECKKILQAETEVFAKLRILISFHFRLFEENPDMAEVITVELRQSSKFMREYKPRHFLEYLRIFSEIIAQGQKEGKISKKLNPRVIRRAIFGAVDEITLDWALSGKKRFAMSQAAEQLSYMLLEGLKMRTDAT